MAFAIFSLSISGVTLTEPPNNMTPLTPTREEVKALAYDRLQEELKKAQEVRLLLVETTSSDNQYFK